MRRLIDVHNPLRELFIWYHRRVSRGSSGAGDYFWGVSEWMQVECEGYAPGGRKPGIRSKNAFPGSQPISQCCRTSMPA
jgi:hypothetical protein